MSKKKQAKEVLADLAAKLADRLIARGIAASDAADIGLSVSEDMAEDWGGQLIYFSIHLAERRNRAIYEDFTGNNHADLVSKYKVSLNKVYSAIRVMRAAEIAKRQGGLFPDTPTSPPC